MNKPKPDPSWPFKTDPKWPFGRMRKPYRPKREKQPDLPPGLF